MARRPFAAALVMIAGALVLTGCLPMPPALPEAPPAAGSPIDPQPADATSPNATVGQQVTVDDGAGDTWAFAVTGIEEDPPVQEGDAEPGTRLVAVLFDGERREGDLAFIDLFDISAVGSDGNAYLWSDTLHVTAEDDIFYAVDRVLSGARAIIQLPEGVDVDMVVVRSYYGHPDVADTVIDVP